MEVSPCGLHESGQAMTQPLEILDAVAMLDVEFAIDPGPALVTCRPGGCDTDITVGRAEWQMNSTRGQSISHPSFGFEPFEYTERS